MGRELKNSFKGGSPVRDKGVLFNQSKKLDVLLSLFLPFSRSQVDRLGRLNSAHLAPQCQASTKTTTLNLKASRGRGPHVLWFRHLATSIRRKILRVVHWFTTTSRLEKKEDIPQHRSQPVSCQVLSSIHALTGPMICNGSAMGLSGHRAIFQIVVRCNKVAIIICAMGQTKAKQGPRWARQI